MGGYRPLLQMYAKELANAIKDSYSPILQHLARWLTPLHTVVTPYDTGGYRLLVEDDTDQNCNLLL